MRALASLSLDLDNKWSYLKTHGDPGWDSFPSYLDVVVPRVLDLLAARDLQITFFIVGQDAVLPGNQASLRSIAEAGHEIGNHSFHHEPWLHLYSREKLVEELSRAEAAIEQATGERPVGFRGPGFSMSSTTLDVLAERGYEYDCSTFPTFLGPVARTYYFMTAQLSREEKQARSKLFGSFSEGFRSLRPYQWTTPHGQLLEIPVTTMPLFKLPIHLSYVLYLGQFSQLAAVSYFRSAMRLCQLMNIEPSLLLHPLDFMGCDDDADLGFFPAMSRKSSEKIRLAVRILDDFRGRFETVPMIQHARRSAHRADPLPIA